MENKKIKIYGIVLGVILFIILVAGFTYAALTWRSSNITITGASECLEVDSVKGSNITGSDLLLLDENQIINNNRITITSGMVVTNITAKLYIRWLSNYKSKNNNPKFRIYFIR